MNKCVSAYLGLDDKRPVSSYSDLLLHDAEPVEPADEQTGTVQSEGEVHVVAGEAVLVVLDVLTPVDIEEQEVVEVTSGERLPLSNTWRDYRSPLICLVVQQHCLCRFILIRHPRFFCCRTELMQSQHVQNVLQ